MNRILFIFLLFFSFRSYSQWKTYMIGAKGDTLNAVDMKGQKQGKWVNHYDEIRGEPGFEEEGEFKNNRKEGNWRIYTLSGDLAGLEFYKWGNKDGVCQYFAKSGALLKEEGWRALNPDKPYDTLQVEDLDHLNQYRTVVVKNDGAAIKDGTWNYYDTETGMILRSETYTLGKLEKPKTISRPDSASMASKANTKPKEVLDFEKKTGKKKVKVQDGSVY